MRMYSENELRLLIDRFLDSFISVAVSEPVNFEKLGANHSVATQLTAWQNQGRLSMAVHPSDRREVGGLLEENLTNWLDENYSPASGKDLADHFVEVMEHRAGEFGLDDLILMFQLDGKIIDLGQLLLLAGREEG